MRRSASRNGKLAAVVVSVEDVEALEDLEMAHNLQAYRQAKAEEDGERVSLEDLRTELRA